MKMRSACLSAVVVVAAVVSVAGFAAALEVSRDEALSRRAESISRVRENMSSNPAVVQWELGGSLAPNLGNDLEVLRLCDEVIHSSNTVSQGHVVMALETIHSKFPAVSAKTLADMLRVAVTSQDVNVRLLSIQVLTSFGGQYRQEGKGLFRQALKDGLPPERVYSFMIPNFGGSPEVINYYSSILATSTSTTAAQEALSGLATISQSHLSGSEGQRVRKDLAKAFRVGMRKPNAAVQLKSAWYLETLGAPFKNETRRFYERRLRESFGDDADAREA